MSDQLTTDQLEAIQRLISEPLRIAVRMEMQTGNDRLAASVLKLAEQFEAHAADALRRERSREARMGAIESRLAGFERFRGKVLLVYAVLTVALSLAWSMFREWLMGLNRKR